MLIATPIKNTQAGRSDVRYIMYLEKHMKTSLDEFCFRFNCCKFEGNCWTCYWEPAEWHLWHIYRDWARLWQLERL